jgi:sialate O-acetylesterase
MKRNVKGYCIIIISLTFINAARGEERWKKILDLEGRWKFAIGDNKKWSAPSFNDHDWEDIDVPSNWEDEGFNGYNGYAWYRITFDGSELQNKSSSFHLFLGYIDDVDEVYLNGQKIGATGSFPPRYHTGYNSLRNYYVPTEYLNLQSKNVIAVRVYDAEVEGGIVSGDIGIFINEADQGLALNLRGMWDFTLLGKKYNYPDHGAFEKKTPPTTANWTKLSVPGLWEHQGYHEYDGSAWYRKQFSLPKQLQGQDLVLILGKIDDYDQTYLNGKLIGSTNAHDKLRIYNISAEDFNAAGLNLLMVFVDDPQGDGGIYEGPIGLIKQSELTRYLRWKR